MTGFSYRSLAISTKRVCFCLLSRTRLTTIEPVDPVPHRNGLSEAPAGNNRRSLSLMIAGYCQTAVS